MTKLIKLLIKSKLFNQITQNSNMLITIKFSITYIKNNSNICFGFWVTFAQSWYLLITDTNTYNLT